MNKRTNKVITLFMLLLLVITTLIPIQASVSAASPTLADGEYSLDFTFLKDGEEQASTMDGFTEKPAKLIVEDSKKYVEITLTNSSMIQSLKLGTDDNGQNVDLISEDENGDKRVVGFEVDDLSEKIEFYTHVIVPPTPPVLPDGYDSKYRVQLKFDLESLTVVNVPEEPTNPVEPEEPTDPVSPVDEGIYEVDFDVLHATEDKASSMGNYVKKPVKLIVTEEGKNFIEFILKSSDMIPSFQVEQKGQLQEVELVKEYEANNERKVRFEMPELSEVVNAKVKVDTKSSFGIMEHGVRLRVDVESISPFVPTEPSLEDGIYTADLEVLHETKATTSSMAKYVKNPVKLIITEEGENFIELILKSSDMIPSFQVEQEGQLREVELVKEYGANNERKVRFEMSELSKVVNAKVKVDTKSSFGIMEHGVRLEVDMDSISPFRLTEPQLADGEYTIDFTALQANNDEISSADKRFSKPATLLVEEGKKFISFSVEDSSTIQSLKVEQDGDLVEVETISENEEEDTRFIQFEVGSLVEELNANVHVVVPELDFESSPDFRIVFDTDSIHLVKEDVDEEPGENPDSGNGNPGTTPNPKPEKPSEELFTIDFKVLKDGTNAVSVMDQYTNKPAELKVKDGRNYISLTLLNSSWIKEFKVGGSSPKVISENSKANTRVVQFEVSDLSKKLNATTHVVIPESEFPGAGSYDERYTVQIEFDPSSKKPLKGSIPSPTTPEKPTTPTPPKTIKGADGGKVESNGAVINFPTAVFTGDFIVTVQKLGNLSSLPLEDKQFFAGDVLEITKDKTGDFKKAITITLPFDKTKVDMQKHELGLYWFNETTKKWIKLDNIKVDFDTGKVSGEVNHFTKFAVLATEKTEDSKNPEKPEQTIRFKDINGHWAENHIYSLVKLGAVNGYPTGEFRPNNSITRAEFATILVKASDLSIITGSKFADTKNHWANDYIITAEAHGIINGYSDKTFGPNDLLTREQMAVMIVRAKGIKGNKASLTFKDAKQIATWAKDAVETAVDAEIITGYPNQTFKPKGNATRAEAVTVVVKASN